MTTPEIEIIHVLGKGYIRLEDHMGSDLSIVRAARVSFNRDDLAGQDLDKDKKLINYLWKNQHTTPFESVVFTFEVKAPIFVFRQWHRHRTQSYNELSARYTVLEDEFYTPLIETIGVQGTGSKQTRDIAPITGNIEEYDKRRRQLLEYEHICRNAFSAYETLLGAGWPRELARMVLPVSTFSKMYTTVNLLNLFRFIKLRTHPHAQFEIREYADAALELIYPYVPEAVDAFRENIVREG